MSNTILLPKEDVIFIIDILRDRAGEIQHKLPETSKKIIDISNKLETPLNPEPDISSPIKRYRAILSNLIIALSESKRIAAIGRKSTTRNSDKNIELASLEAELHGLTSRVKRWRKALKTKETHS